MTRRRIRIVPAHVQVALVALLAGLLWVGPGQAQAAAGTCVSPGGRPDPQDVTALLTESTGVSLGLTRTEIRWVRWHTRVVYGDSAVLEGQVVTQDGALPDATVDLFARQAGASDWVQVDSATSDPDTGVFSFDCLKPSMTTDYRAVYQGTLLYAGSTGERRIDVARRVPDSMTQMASERFRFAGSVAPRYADRPVLLQRKTCLRCGWKTVAGTRTTTRSAWRFTVDVSSFTGDRWFRAVVPADSSFVRSYSARSWRLRHR
jgi:hypothetical protein